MITSDKIFKVIENFKKVLPLAKHTFNLNMLEGDVNKHQECGTVHCHGGWYAVATCDLSQPLTFYAGAEQLAVDLGFEGYTDLQSWANQHYRIWGNDKGSYLFGSRIAFESVKRPVGAMTLQDIVDHWTEVYYRLKEHEELGEY